MMLMPMSRVRMRSMMSSISSLVGAFLRIQVEVGDDLLEPRAAHDLLADRLQPILDARRHRRPDVALGTRCGTTRISVSERTDLAAFR
jgi:hypothetical protein